MATWMDKWGRPILHNVAATAIYGAVIVVGGKAASMTPALQPYAPFSYVLGGLLCLLLAVLILGNLPRFKKAGLVLTPAEAPPVPHGDTREILRKLEVIEHNHGNLRDLVTALGRDMNALKTKMEAVIEGVIAGRALETVAELHAKIGRERPVLMLPEEHPHLSSHLDQARGIAEGIQAWCRRMGWPYYDDYVREVQQTAAQIRADAINCTLEPGEEKKWASGTHKQTWLLNLAQLRSMRRLVQHLRRELPAKAQLHSIKDIGA
jgi:hypothetical protein